MTNFGQQLLNFKDKVEKRCLIILPETSIILQELVMNDTPVLTGRLKANWFLTINEPAQTSLYKDVNVKPIE